MVGGLGRAASGFGASILLLESDSANYLVNFVVNYILDLSLAAMQFTTKFTR